MDGCRYVWIHVYVWMAGLGGWMDGCRYVYMCMCGWLG